MNDYLSQRKASNSLGVAKELYKLAITAAKAIPTEQGKLVQSVENAKASILNKYGDGSAGGKVVPMMAVLVVVGLVGVVML